MTRSTTAADDDSWQEEFRNLSPFGAIPCIVVIGKTGSGKSSFIDTLGGRDMQGNPPIMSASIDSCTNKPTVYIANFQRKKVLLLDTPGFDDSARDNISVLNDIASHLWTVALRNSELETKGVIFLHDIGESRFSGSQRKTWEILGALCGQDCMKNVIVGTTMWSNPNTTKFKKEEKREQEILAKYWQEIHKTMRIPYEDEDCAKKVIAEILAMPSVTLLIQKEMLVPPHNIENTTAGKIAIPEGKAEAKRLKEEMEELKKQHEKEILERQKEIRRLEEQRLQREEELKREFEEERKKQQEENRRMEEELEKKFEAERKRLDESHRSQLEDKFRLQKEAHQNQYQGYWRQDDERQKQEAADRATELQKMRDENAALMSDLEEKRRNEEERLNQQIANLQQQLENAKRPPPPPPRRKGPCTIL